MASYRRLASKALFALSYLERVYSTLLLNKFLKLLKPLMELHAPQGPWPQRLQQRPALEVVPQAQQDHIYLFSLGVRLWCLDGDLLVGGCSEDAVRFQGWVVYCLCEQDGTPGAMSYSLEVLMF